MSLDSPASSGTPPKKMKYVRAVGPRLRKLLYFVFVLVALLFANSGYLATITLMEWWRSETYQDYYYQFMFLAHLAMGLVLILPLVIFGFVHMWNTRNRRNRRALRIGYALFSVSLTVLATGILLMRVSGFDLKQPFARSVVYWLHVACPLAAVWLYWLHRLVGPKIKWKVGIGFAGVAVASILGLVALQMQDPRDWNAVGPESGTEYFLPSFSRTASGNFIPAKTLMQDQYCLKCHEDVHKQWADSVHRFSSFNNPPYLASVMDTRAVSLERDGNVKGTRFCAGCHDPVPFFSGAFDDPDFDMLDHVTAKAGITCTVCHAITNVNSVRGNGDYTIEEPLHYPFAYSENAAFQWINNQLVKAKPSFHKKTFLKPFHKTAEFCSTCHKVHLPYALNHYKEFLRGQNHYDSYLLSGVSGHGARSFYYPKKAEHNCNECHMPLTASNDFGAKDYEGADAMSVHDHLFPSANTGISWLRDRAEVTAKHQDFLKDNLRIDLFALREGVEIDGEKIAPLRPSVPTLKPGSKYLLDAVVRTLNLGHHFTQGTTDSNEVWIDVKVTSGDRLIGRSGEVNKDAQNEVDPWSHFLNVFMLDKDGRRIDRRNAEDIFTPLYNHQLPPGAAQTVHYELDIPEDVNAPVKVEVKVLYRKFDQHYMNFVADKMDALGRPIRGTQRGEAYVNDLPITTIATDSIVFPIEGVDVTPENADSKIPLWQRWNDYGIGLLLKGKGELRQAEEAFLEVEKLDRYDGPLNLARVFNIEGRLDDAVDALNRATKYADTEGFPRWTWAWLSGDVNAQQGRLEEAEQNLRSVLEDNTEEMQRRGFDFSYDIEVINLLGRTLFDLGNVRFRQGRDEEVQQYLSEAVLQFKRTLEIDPENVSAHHNLQQLYEKLGDETLSAKHRELHLTYKPDDNAQGRAIRLARQRYPAANHAAEAVVKYSLIRSLQIDTKTSTTE
ncbi:Tetratricopeptide repeat protein [Planctomycetes bacterium CA13]|uniref:Tetratricopeptide repeat protein n=1 Tax=Novipirellula herctigrandis TaxID=2527986 RepID=A0A5C5YNX4_9BACT|nr:Tetratricopeptide repeat protein [Planctomycetes bacterium CA13]